ncbi:uncharacterized protein LOC123205410 [Mangifera indica]|uniref:uncharacterized protein LOC123205410 n=1 Tax=Mangifera indica TaxID=29780 RepID=UPI001CFA1E39|nr:uncharacterized protein LOC123205410 [Mangifera indica]
MLPIVHFLNFDQTFRIIIQCNNPPSWFKRLPTKQELKECIEGGRLRQLIVRVILAVIFLNLYSRMAFYLHATIAVGSILAVIFRGSKGPLFLAVLYGMLCFHHWSARRAYLREIRRLPWLVKRLLPIVHFLNFDQAFHNIFHYKNLPPWFKRSQRRIIRQNL